ncbi:MAG: hypothetical protein K1Y36_28920 [Blastocatellia bacterium]|nr:hypothetical protein [Blastocatellia bacterium]
MLFCPHSALKPVIAEWAIRCVWCGVLGLWLFLGGGSQPVAAQYCFDSWTTDDGLPQNGVRSIGQTPDGYLWFTTLDGLVRFDGVRFTVFNRSNSKGIVSNRFTQLFVASDGTLWTTTEGGNLTRYRQGVFSTIPVIIPGAATNPQEISDFREPEPGRVLLLISRNWYQLFEGVFALVKSIPPNRLLKTYQGQTGATWTLTPDLITEERRGVVTTYPTHLTLPYAFDHNPPNPNLRDWNGVFEDHEGRLWVGDLTGMHCFQHGTSQFFGPNEGLPGPTIFHSFWEESDGSLWFASGDSNYQGIGLVCYKNGRMTVWGSSAGLSNNRIYRVFRDREGVVWLATNKGLNRLRRQLVKTYSVAQGLLSNEVYPILQTRNGDIWIGSTLGLTRIRGTQFTPMEIKKPFEVGALALLEDKTGCLWVGSVGRMFWYENNRFEQVPEFTETPATIFQDSQGTIWVGCGNGLFQFQGKNLTGRLTTANGLPHNDVKVVYEDSGGTLWVGTYGGLVGFRDGQRVTYDEAHGLAGNRVRALFEDKQGTLWIGTYDNGLSRLKNGRLFTYRLEQGLFDNGVFSLLEDFHGYFWISCNRGIYRVSKQELNQFADGLKVKIQSTVYNKKDGMFSTECNGGRQPAGIKASDGRLWFPTQDGVSVIDTEAVSLNSMPPPVRIETVKVEREPVADLTAITLLPDQDDLEITYTGLSFIKSEQVRFKYRLLGKDDDWLEAGTRRTAYYTYIPPGTYTFQVVAANSDGVWNQQGASLTIRVLAPLWQRWWFLLSLGLLAVGLTALLFWARITELRRRQAAQVAFSRQLLESQEAERQRIAAEMHDSLGQHLLVIKNWATLGLTLSTAEAKNRQQLAEISETATEALNEVRQIVYDLRPYQLDKIGLTQTLRFTIQQLLASAGMEPKVEIDEIDGLFPKSQEIIVFRIVQECLNNIVKHSLAATVTIAIKRESDIVAIAISDDGCGFDATRTGAAKSGFGLTGLSERVRMLGGDHHIHSIPGEGSHLSFRLPIHEQAQP